MNIEKELLKEGIVVTEKIDTNLIFTITNNIAKRISETFSSYNLDETIIFSKLCSLGFYKTKMPPGMQEAFYCYKNSSIYFNNKISNEDLEEFAIHECLHHLQEIKDKNGKIVKMGLSNYNAFKTIGTSINEAAVQYLSTKIIGIKPDFEKYYDINIFTPSPSYYPMECALLNELIFFLGEDLLFKSTYYSDDEFKNAIIQKTSKAFYEKIVKLFDDILNYEEKLIILENKLKNSSSAKNLQKCIIKCRKKIKDTFLHTQNLIIINFFEKDLNNIKDLEQLENYRRSLNKFEKIVAKTSNYVFFNNFYIETMNKLEHMSNIFENGGIETAPVANTFSISYLLKKIRQFLYKKAEV